MSDLQARIQSVIRCFQLIRFNPIGRGEVFVHGETGDGFQLIRFNPIGRVKVIEFYLI